MVKYQIYFHQWLRKSTATNFALQDGFSSVRHLTRNIVHFLIRNIIHFLTQHPTQNIVHFLTVKDEPTCQQKNKLRKYQSRLLVQLTSHYLKSLNHILTLNKLVVNRKDEIDTCFLPSIYIFAASDWDQGVKPTIAPFSWDPHSVTKTKGEIGTYVLLSVYTSAKSDQEQGSLKNEIHNYAL